MKSLRYLGALGTMTASVLAIPASSPADISIDVTPAKYEMSIPAGKNQTVPVTIRNTTDTPVHILASLTDFQVGVNGSYTFSAAGNNKYSMGHWISLNPREFDLPPNTATQVRLSVDVPANATGEYASMLFFTTRPTRHAGGLSIAERVASKVYEVVPDSARLSAEIESVSAKQLSDGSHYLIGMRNSGNTHLYLSGRVEIKQGEQLVDRVTLPGALVMERGGKRIVDALGKRLAPGSYTAIAMIDYGGPNLTAGKTTFTVR